MLEEQIIHTEKIYEGRIVKLDVHEVRLPDNKTAKREVIRHPGAVALIALDDEDNVLLIRQYRTGAKQVMIEIPAGTLEPNEPIEQCAMRELQEETGYRANQLERIGGWFVTPGYTTEYIHLFLARHLELAPMDGDQDEFIERFRVPLKQAIAMVDTGQIINTTAICGLLKIARYLNL